MNSSAEMAYSAFRKRAGGMAWAELPEADRADWEAVASALQCPEPVNVNAGTEIGAFIDHDLKIDPERLAEVRAGTKTHEIRVFDRDYQVGNTLRLNGYDRLAKAYTGQAAMVRVTNITPPGSYGLPENVGVMSIALATTCIDKTQAATATHLGNCTTTLRKTLTVNTNLLQATLTQMLLNLKTGPYDSEEVCLLEVNGLQIQLKVTADQDEFIEPATEGLVSI